MFYEVYAKCWEEYFQLCILNYGAHKCVCLRNKRDGQNGHNKYTVSACLEILPFIWPQGLIPTTKNTEKLSVFCAELKIKKILTYIST
jgi:hypothetical protein